MTRTRIKREAKRVSYAKERAQRRYANIVLGGLPTPRAFPVGVTSPAVKRHDPETQALIDAALNRRAPAP